MLKKSLSVLLAVCLLTGCTARRMPEPETPASSAHSEVAESLPPVEESELEEESTPPASSETTREEASSMQESSAPPKAEQQPAENSAWQLLLVNYENAIPEDFAPELAEVQGGYKMDARVADAAKQMITDAKAQGVELLVCSAYRPYSSQQRNFSNSVNSYISAGYTKENAVIETMKLIAEPGKSEHQTGLAADIVTPAYQSLDDGYANTTAAKWLLNNAANYGFILRFPKDKTTLTKIDFEPWHYRYVGVDAAKEIMGQGICLEEYLG